MIRDRLKNAARKAALKAFGMEKQAEDRVPRPKVAPGSEIDLSKIPKLVDGDGDTPGPKHMTRIGRTWVAAQIASSVSHCIVDVRTPEEWTTGTLPGALCISGDQLKTRLEVLPEVVCEPTHGPHPPEDHVLERPGSRLARCVGQVGVAPRCQGLAPWKHDG